MIDFGIQAGGRDSGDIINQLWNELLEIFYDNLDKDNYFKKVRVCKSYSRFRKGILISVQKVLEA